MYHSLRKNREFLNVYHHGKSYANKYLVMYIVENSRQKTRFGISVSKKVGNSVVRHRTVRLIRESIRLHEPEFLTGYDIVIIARTSAKGRKYQDIESALLHLGRKQGVLKR